MYLIKIFTNILDQPIELKTTNPNSVIVGTNEYSEKIGTRIRVIDTNYYLKVVIDDKISIDWNRGGYFFFFQSRKRFNFSITFSYTLIFVSLTFRLEKKYIHFSLHKFIKKI